MSVREPDHYEPARALRLALSHARGVALDAVGVDTTSPLWDLVLELAELEGRAAEWCGALDPDGGRVWSTPRERQAGAHQIRDRLRDVRFDDDSRLAEAIESARRRVWGVVAQAEQAIAYGEGAS